MRIIIIADGEYIKDSSDYPVVGAKYTLEDAETGTGAQNKAAHALIQEYFKSGCYSDEATTWLELKEQLKRGDRLGAGFDAFVYVYQEKFFYKGYGGIEEEGTRPVIKDAKKYKDIPEYIRTHPDKKKMIRGKLKSWTNYTMKQRKTFLDGLIAEMDTAGVQTKKYYEIIDGMREKSATPEDQ